MQVSAPIHGCSGLRQAVIRKNPEVISSGTRATELRLRYGLEGSQVARRHERAQDYSALDRNQ